MLLVDDEKVQVPLPPLQEQSNWATTPSLDAADATGSAGTARKRTTQPARSRATRRVIVRRANGSRLGCTIGVFP
jgi:hypothetical protein